MSKLTKNQVLSETQYYKVNDISGNLIELITDDGQKIKVSKEYAEQMLSNAETFTEVKKVSRTELVETLLTNARVAMTVNYNKKVDEKSIYQTIIDLYPNKGGKLSSQSDFQKKVKAALNLKGEERTMVGRHYGSQDTNGRLHFIDMNIDKDSSKSYDNRQRLVDPRTINWLIVNNVKYQVK